MEKEKKEVFPITVFIYEKALEDDTLSKHLKIPNLTIELVTETPLDFKEAKRLDVYKKYKNVKKTHYKLPSSRIESIRYVVFPYSKFDEAVEFAKNNVKISVLIESSVVSSVTTDLYKLTSWQFLAMYFKQIIKEGEKEIETEEESDGYNENENTEVSDVESGETGYDQ